MLDIRVNEDATAELANDDLLMHTDVELALRRYLAVATAARVALDGNDSQTVAGVLADALERGQQTVVNLTLQIGGLQYQRFGLLLGLGKDRVKILTLVRQVNGALLDIRRGLGFLGLQLLKGSCMLLDALLA